MSKRVAVVVVHGVADQSPGDTLRSVVDLLVAASPDKGCYSRLETEELTLPVPPLKSMSESWRFTMEQQSSSGSGALKRSATSELARGDPTSGAANISGAPDITLTNTLLAQHATACPDAEVYCSTRIGLQRRGTNGAGETTELDLFEMYWADLSRLSGSVPRIVSEVFTLIFRLSRLARDTVTEAGEVFAKKDRRKAWQCLQWLQTWLDWILVHPLAMLTSQLALLGLILLGLGLLRYFDEHVRMISTIISMTIVFGAGCCLWYNSPRRSGWWDVALCVAFITGGSPLFLDMAHHWVPFAALIGLATIANVSVLRAAAERFSLDWRVGLALWAVLIFLVALSAAVQLMVDDDPVQQAIWIRSAIFGIEVILGATKVVWIVLGVMLPLWFVAGWLVSRKGGLKEKASVITGRLGLGLALAGFLMLTIVAWAALSMSFKHALTGIDVVPCIFEAAMEEKVRIANGNEVSRCPLNMVGASTTARLQDAGVFLDDRYKSSVAPFALIASLFVALLAYLLIMLLPSVLAERRLLRDGPDTKTGWDRLGHWLTGGFRYLDSFVSSLLAIGALVALMVAAFFVLDAFFDKVKLNLPWETLQSWSAQGLEPFVFSGATIGGILVLLGGALSKYLPAIRGPLDMILDVDNYFRTLPRSEIPRARIFSRYAALLREINSRHARRRYDRIVVVAHSQGGVISAELLRYLSSDGVGKCERYPKLDDKDLPRVLLMTFGCPLRQLYASRFPPLYGWTEEHGSMPNPVNIIGAVRWANAFCSGDYVGRSLWSGESKDASLDPVHNVRCLQSRQSQFESLPYFEVCLGLGAHTHYFDVNQSRSASLIDWMITRRLEPVP